jgi:hypothetical protein
MGKSMANSENTAGGALKRLPNLITAARLVLAPALIFIPVPGASFTPSICSAGFRIC